MNQAVGLNIVLRIWRIFWRFGHCCGLSLDKTKCCLCNGSGRCLNCRCVKLGEACSNCNPLNHSRCMNWKVRSATAYSKDDESRPKQLTPVKSLTTNVSMATLTKPSCKTSSTTLPSPVSQAEALSYFDVVKKSPLYTSSPTQLPLEYKKKAVSQTGSLLSCSVSRRQWQPRHQMSRRPRQPWQPRCLQPS